MGLSGAPSGLGSTGTASPRPNPGIRVPGPESDPPVYVSPHLSLLATRRRRNSKEAQLGAGGEPASGLGRARRWLGGPAAVNAAQRNGPC